MGALVYDVPHAAIADAEAGDVGAVATLTDTTRFAAPFLPGSYGPVGLLTFGPLVTITGAGTLPKLTGAATLTETITVTGAGTLPKLTGAATLVETLTVTGAGTLPKLTGAATVVETIPLVGAGTLPKLTGAATVTVTVTVPDAPGTITATFAPTGSTTGVQGP